MTLTALIENKAKAVAGAVSAAVAVYVATAIITSTVLTLHGLEGAAAGAVLGFLGVHQAPENKPRRRNDAGYTLIEVLIIVVVVLFVVWLIFALRH